MRGVRVWVVMGVHVKPVGRLPPSGRDLEGLSGGRGTHHGVRRVDRPTLSPMSSRGIGELDVLTNVDSRDLDHAGTMTSLQGKRPVGMGAGHAPLVTIADPVLSGVEPSVV